jgi:hypothetical protein
MSNARTVEVVLDGEWAGYRATMKADGISARVFIELSSGNVERQMLALGKLVVSHEFQDGDGNRVDDILDAPMEALGILIGKWGEAVAALPPR